MQQGRREVIEQVRIVHSQQQASLLHLCQCDQRLRGEPKQVHPL